MDGRMDVKWREECLPFRGIYAIAMLLSSPGTLARSVRSALLVSVEDGEARDVVPPEN